MPKRHKISRRKSKKLFRKTASHTHRRNLPRPGAKAVMRGGIRA